MTGQKQDAATSSDAGIAATPPAPNKVSFGGGNDACRVISSCYNSLGVRCAGEAKMGWHLGLSGYPIVSNSEIAAALSEERRIDLRHQSPQCQAGISDDGPASA
jgi:hypothetical protein